MCRLLFRFHAPTVMSVITAAFLFAGGRQGEAEEPTRESISIVYPDDAESPVRIAAEELAAGLGGLFPDDRFRVVKVEPRAEAKYVIYLGTPASLPKIAAPAANRLQGAESYAVTTTEAQGKTVGVIVGADSRGVMYGAHGLLQKLGCGTYLGFAASPVRRSGPFRFDGWDLADRPLVPNRIVFNWHNFLSGCSTWNLEHWRRWVKRSQKMGFNTVMVHAYGNNPMAGFRFRGRDKPAGGP